MPDSKEPGAEEGIQATVGAPCLVTHERSAPLSPADAVLTLPHRTVRRKELGGAPAQSALGSSSSEHAHWLPGYANGPMETKVPVSVLNDGLCEAGAMWMSECMNELGGDLLGW